jgi:hypothetical protein
MDVRRIVIFEVHCDYVAAGFKKGWHSILDFMPIIYGKICQNSREIMAIFAVIYGSDPGIGYRVWIQGLRPTMDIEFHYYMTYLVAARAGFRPAAAAIIAQAAQEVDDNHIPIAVSKGTPAEYESVISQTMDILHPRHIERI